MLKSSVQNLIFDSDTHQAFRITNKYQIPVDVTLTCPERSDITITPQFRTIPPKTKAEFVVVCSGIDFHQPHGITYIAVHSSVEPENPLIISVELVQLKRRRPPLLVKASRFEQTFALHRRVIELSQNAVPRVKLHSSINSRCDEYLTALTELRQGKLNVTVHRDMGDYQLDDMKCYNSY